MTDAPKFTQLPDLAVRSLGGSVVWANDESFAEKENLIRPLPPGYSPATFGHKGQVYDGWETRRRREPGCDEAIVRLGVPGVIHGVVVDTAFFTGNYPPEISLEAAAVAGYPSPETLRDEAKWEPLVLRTAVTGDSANMFPVSDERRFTHVKLTLHPDGGVARLRVHGYGAPDPEFLTAGPVDVAALENGGHVTGCSNWFYSSPHNLLMPGYARVMGDGWETSRRRFPSGEWESSNDWVEVHLAAEAALRVVELDTTCFLHNAPGAASVRGRVGDEWVELLPRTALQPDTRHRFRVDDEAGVTDLRLDIYPDGGLSRLRAWGTLTPAGLAALTEPR
ncbi:allantoicase [Hoyosella altamirensis]|uniref:Probable allantoicase n=1 Tax=Hoyosella altamirensis TaxID=616997 RepID=A0A839RUL7_9ACTN|nr:allantoicase [Hoyosella altamirensis]MBB3039501.1 allantoicase [Hoyosella altamirensis]